MSKLITHVSVGVNDIARIGAFYDQVMLAIGVDRTYEIADDAIAYGEGCEFWVVRPDNESEAASAGNGVHIAFTTKSTAMVDEFYETAISNGGFCAGKPGFRDHYVAGYYAAFVKDPEGNKIEAVFYSK